jgi:hypothetical protein
MGLSEWDSTISLMVNNPYKAMDFWDDIITIMDSGSVLNGKQYILRFGRENRHPALDNIGIHKSIYPEYDFVVMEGQTINITPNPNASQSYIYDPDEDNLTYYYTGWKETCDDFVYDEGIDNSCSQGEPTSPAEHFDVWNKGATPNEICDTVDCPHNWTTSEEYLLTGRGATFTPLREDVGEHNLTVWVCDEAGLCDYQIVRILVLDYARPYLNGTNPYFKYNPFIPYDAASVEDYYRLSGEATTISDQSAALIDGYVFTDGFEPFEIITSSGLQILDLPLQPPMESRDIQEITKYNFSIARLGKTDVAIDGLISYCEDTGLPPDDPRAAYYNYCNHTINLTIQGLQTEPAQMNVSVYQCLPYYNTEDPYPWPYNNTPDAFLSSHACCSPGDELEIVVSYDPPGGDTHPVLGRDIITIYNTVYGNNIDEVQIYNSTDDLVGRSNSDWQNGYLNPQPFTNAAACLEESTTTFFTISADPLTHGLTDVAAGPSSGGSSPSTGLGSGIVVTGSEVYPLCILNNQNRSFTISFDSATADIGSTTYSQKGVDPGEYTVLLVAKEDTMPPWGAWFSTDQVCYGGQDKIGVLGALEKSYDDVSIEGLPSDDEPNYYTIGGTSTVREAIWNDVVVMSFTRKCSGMRGNTCTGAPDMTYRSVYDCPGMLEGEVESCNGPSKFYPDPHFEEEGACTDPADDACNTDGEDVGGCFAYSYPLTFESKYELSRRDDPAFEANGVCNDHPTCSDSDEEYDAAEVIGQYLIAGAGCDDGECTAPADTYNCGAFNGTTDSTGNELPFSETFDILYNHASARDKFCKLKGKSRLVTSGFSCREESEQPQCYLSDDELDPDTSKAMCDVCRETDEPPGEHIMSTSSTWKSSGLAELKCCGDDIGEGAFPYKAASKNAYRASSPTEANKNGAGSYNTPKETVCDDYYTSNTATNWIDNDCDGDYNCEDKDCYSGSSKKYGPLRGVCCNNNNNCHDKFGITHLFAKVTCSSDKECKCSLNPETEMISPSANTIRICVGYTVFSPITLNDLDGHYTFSAESMDDSLCKQISIDGVPINSNIAIPTEITNPEEVANGEPNSNCILILEKT